jgi:WD40 repeat protein
MNLPTKFNVHPFNRRVYHYNTHTAPVNSVKFDGNVIFSSSKKGIIFFDATSGQKLDHFPKDILEVISSSSVWSPCSGKIALVANNGTLQLLDVSNRNRCYRYPYEGHATSPADVLVYSPDGKKIAVGYKNGTLQLLDASRIRNPIVEHIKAHNWPISCLVYNPDGTKIVSGSFDHTIKLWNSNSLQPIYALEGHTDLVLAVDCSPDGTRIVSGSKDGTLRLWDADYRKCIKIIRFPERDYVRSLSYIQNGQYIAVGMHKGTVILFDNKLIKIGSAIQVDVRSILSISANPNGTKIVSGSFSGRVSTVNVSTFLCS